MLMNAGRHHLRGQAWKGLRGRWQISKDGGIYPEWRGAGKEIIFQASTATKGTVIMAVEVKADGRTFESRLPKRLFEAPSPNYWGVTADASDSCLAVPPNAYESAPTTITVQLN